MDSVVDRAEIHRVDYLALVGENKQGYPDQKSGVFISGPVAQLGARFHGMEEVKGSNPFRSTKIFFISHLARDSALALPTY